MTKERFTYELIDNWLYLISEQCVLMENYTQKDRTNIYVKCIEKLEKCFDYYDQVYEKVDPDQHSEEEIDSILEFLIQNLKNETEKNIIEEIKTELCINFPDVEQFMDKYFYHDEKGKDQEITKSSLIRFITELRRSEENQQEIAGI